MNQGATASCRMPSPESKRVLHAYTVAYSALTLSRGVFNHLARMGFENHIVAGSTYGSLKQLEDLEGVAGVHELPLTRDMTPMQDVQATLQMRRLIGALRPALIHANSPKASFVTACARPAHVPLLYMVRGMPLDELQGPARRLGVLVERFTSRRAAEVVYISQSLADHAQELGVAPPHFDVLGSGSSNGVDCRRFRIADERERERRLQDFGIGGAPVFGLVGRVTPAKGLVFLRRLWPRIRAQWPRASLVVIGAADENRPPTAAQRLWLSTGEGVHWLGHVGDTSSVVRILDVHLFPSHREGFGNVAIEAGASGVPTIAVKGVGTRDSVLDGVSGLLVPRDEVAWLRAIDTVLGWAPHRPAIRSAICERFAQDLVWSRLASKYDEVLARAE